MVDADLLPETRQRGELVALQPLMQRRFLFGRGLHLLQRRQLRIGGRVLPARVRMSFRSGGIGGAQGFGLGLQRVEAGLDFGDLPVEPQDALIGRVHACRIRCCE